MRIIAMFSSKAGALCAMFISILLCSSFANAAPHMQTHRVIDVPSGELVSVQLLSDIGSRISNEGDTFAVVTIEDLYVRGHLVLPKGSPGYGEITGIKRSGMFHSGGEFRFQIRRLVAPDGTDIHVDMIGATGDAARQTEHNGNGFGRWALFGVYGLFAARGNDMLVKKGALLHVVTENTRDVSIVSFGTRPAELDGALVSQQ
jgi:hypothetical protein